MDDRARNFAHAEVLFSLGRFADCIDALGRHLATFPNDAHALAVSAAAHMNLSPAEPHRARLLCDQSLSLVPTSSYALYVRAVIAQRVYTHRPDSKYRSNDMMLESRRLARESLAQDPQFLPSWLIIAGIERALGNRKSMRRAIDEALAIDASSAEALMLLSEWFTWTKDRDAAAAAARQALAVAPDRASTHLFRGRQLIKSRQLTAAGEHVREALRINPTSREAQATLNEVMLRRSWLRGPAIRCGRWLVRGPSTGVAGRLRAGLIAMFLVIGLISAGIALARADDRAVRWILIGGTTVGLSAAAFIVFRRVCMVWKARPRRPHPKRP